MAASLFLTKDSVPTKTFYTTTDIINAYIEAFEITSLWLNTYSMNTQNKYVIVYHFLESTFFVNALLIKGNHSLCYVNLIRLGPHLYYNLLFFD